MFNFLSNSSKTSSNSYPIEVLEIHHEFETASIRLLKEANEIINSRPVINKSKLDALKSLGFIQTKEVVESSEILYKTELSKETIDLVNYYQRNYPFNKFIIEEQVKAICHKYNLVCGDVTRFKGFVPEKNLNEIVNFKLKEDDVIEYVVKGTKGEFYVSKEDITPSTLNYLNHRSDSYVEYSNGEINVKGGDKKFGKYAKVFRESPPLKICAPVKDMDISGLELEGGYKLIKKHIPDPVVLQPVRGGYLILTAWGDEASDPLVVNQINN